MKIIVIAFSRGKETERKLNIPILSMYIFYKNVFIFIEKSLTNMSLLPT